MSAAFDQLRIAPLRRAQVRPLVAEAWTLKDNITMGDAVYVVLAKHLNAVLVTGDLNLVNAPGLPVQTIHP